MACHAGVIAKLMTMGDVKKEPSQGLRLLKNRQNTSQKKFLGLALASARPSSAPESTKTGLPTASLMQRGRSAASAKRAAVPTRWP